MKKILLFLTLGVFLCAGDLKIAAGAGYKKMTTDILKSFPKGNQIDAIYGNMKQITTQAKNTDIAVVIGDKKYLDSSNLKKIKDQKIGAGKLVIIYPKGKNIKNLESLKGNEFKKVAMPDAKKAIYGIAGMQALKNSNLDISQKLLFVSTVPQTASYVISGEVDAGFVNLSEALSIKDKIGGFYEVDKKLYDEIVIVAFSLQSCHNNELCEEFLEFLSSDEVRKIAQDYGL